MLFLAGDDDQVDPVTGSRLLERLGRLRGARGLPQCIFLASCESAKAEAEGELGGLAQRLVRELGMPAVIAMSEAVSVATAQALAAGFYPRLHEHGEVDRALVEATAGLAGRYDSTLPALYSRTGGRPLFGETADRPLSPQEIDLGLAGMANLVAERAPVLSPEFDRLIATLRSVLDVDPAAISSEDRSVRAALDEVNALCQEAIDLGFFALALGHGPPPYDGRCPFRGLYPFRAEDREFFFGREELVEQLIQRLDTHPFLAVLGSSGSGKSSLVLAGLVPTLQVRAPELQLAYMTPGSDPLVQLEAILFQAQGEESVLVVDQFEELFTICTSEDRRVAFLDRLLALVDQQQVILTMRADFWGECAPYRALTAAIVQHQELIAPLDTAELRRAMELQAQRVGLRFEADLSSTILDDVRSEPGAMPLLQHALRELWSRPRWPTRGSSAPGRYCGPGSIGIAHSCSCASRSLTQRALGGRPCAIRACWCIAVTSYKGPLTWTSLIR